MGEKKYVTTVITTANNYWMNLEIKQNTIYNILNDMMEVQKHSFEYRGQTYLTDKDTLNEVYRMSFNGEYDALELFIECSDEIEKL